MLLGVGSVTQLNPMLVTRPGAAAAKVAMDDRDDAYGLWDELAIIGAESEALATDLTPHSAVTQFRLRTVGAYTQS
jgi:hypothetical protein